MGKRVIVSIVRFTKENRDGAFYKVVLWDGEHAEIGEIFRKRDTAVGHGHYLARLNRCPLIVKC